MTKNLIYDGLHRAIAPIFQLKRGKIVFEATAKDPAAEETRLRQAVEPGKVQLREYEL